MTASFIGVVQHSTQAQQFIALPVVDGDIALLGVSTTSPQLVNHSINWTKLSNPIRYVSL